MTMSHDNITSILPKAWPSIGDRVGVVWRVITHKRTHKCTCKCIRQCTRKGTREYMGKVTKMYKNHFRVTYADGSSITHTRETEFLEIPGEEAEIEAAIKLLLLSKS